MSDDLLAGADWTLHGPTGSHPATVPSTVAAVVGDHPELSTAVWEWRTELPRLDGPWRLRCDGLATACDVLIDGRLVGTSASMWQPLTIDLDGTGGELVLRFRPLDTPVARKPRARWRSSLVTDQELRWTRTALLGRMCGAPHTPVPVGPWRPVTLTRAPAYEVTRLATGVRGTTGVLDLEISGYDGPAALLHCGEHVASVADGRAHVEIPNVARWWPHTHGDQPLYDVWLKHSGGRDPLGQCGFRTVTADRSTDGFELSINGTPIFVRGACWVPLDPTSLQASVGELRAALVQVRDAGLNMVRLVGTDAYEQPAFFDLCDELGILVWQDAMLAGFDYPHDPQWLAGLASELGGVLAPLAHRPCLAVVSGGSETEQRPAMLGLGTERRTAGPSVEVVASAAAAAVPDVPVVSSSPSGSPIAHRNSRGIAHWFGVGGYRRPLQDARLAGVRFAAECLAFGALPDTDAAADWQTPRDAGADWDFLDVTAHYVSGLYGADRDDDRWPDLARAAVAECVAHVFTEWRQPRSPCAGGLVLSLRDLTPGPGWGLVDSGGRPKSGWYALRRVCAPRAVLLTGEGQDGVSVHVLNDGPHPLAGLLRIQTWGPGGRTLDAIDVPVSLAPRSGQTYDAEELLGGWRDLTWTYRFGPPPVDVVAATLIVDEIGVSRAVHLPLGLIRPRSEPGLTWQVMGDPDETFTVTLQSEQLARGVVVSAPGWVPNDAWLTVVPGGSATVTLRPEGVRRDDGRPEVAVRHLDRLS